MCSQKKTDKKELDESIGMKLFSHRVIVLSEDIRAAVAQRVISELIALDAEDSSLPITIYLNSPGGEVYSGFGIYDTMRWIKSEVRVVVTGLAASIATVILLGAPKDKRYAMPNSKLLIHQPLIGGVVQGQATDLEITANSILKTREKIAKLYVQETGQPLEKVQRDIERDYWLTAQESVDYGLISKIVSSIEEIK